MIKIQTNKHTQLLLPPHPPKLSHYRPNSSVSSVSPVSPVFSPASMQSHFCNLCFKTFPNGRSLGGHMRSHLFTPPLPKSRRTDLEFESEDYDDASASLLLQDRESETESSQNFTRRRSTRVRKCEKPSRVQVGDSSEPASSISEETSEEDVAFCLMLLSRDRWRDEATKDESTSTDDPSEFDDTAEVRSGSRKKAKGKYRCETCNKVFQSYRASDKKTRLGIPTSESTTTTTKNMADTCTDKVHECPFCDRVFASGQALGGHKRSHASRSDYYEMTSTSMIRIRTRSVPIHARGMIDLNMPAPADDESSQVEFGG